MKRRTKIVATVSDIKCEIPFIKDLIDAGVNVIRLNTAHQTIEASKTVVQNIRKVSDDVAILIDTKGPELRTTSADRPIVLKTGDKINIAGNPNLESNRECLYINYSGFADDVPVDARIIIDDGESELAVISKSELNGSYILNCEAMNDGEIKSKRTVNVPSVKINLPALNEKDMHYVKFAVENDVDFIAHSFVRRKEDVLELKKELDRLNSKIGIISKIENQEGVDNIDEILEHSYGIMIARGDLAIEVPAEKIPTVQKNIIKKCLVAHKPVITATQMLHSMIDKPRPTRAEISDVANAVYDRTDALMLSGETAFGKYPIESVKMMSKIAQEVESGIDNTDEISDLAMASKVTAFLAKSAVEASKSLNTQAIVIDTVTGRTARAISAYRGKSTIFAECYDKLVLRQLGLSYGVKTNSIDPSCKASEFIKKAMTGLLDSTTLTGDSLVVIVAGHFGPERGASYLEIGTIKEILENC